MTDTSTETEHQESAPSEQQPAEKTLTQSEVDRIVTERVAREKQKFADYDDLKTKAQRLQEIEDANKSKEQKAQERIDELTNQLKAATEQVSTLSLENLRSNVAATKGVPAGRLRGTTKEEIEADADAYLAEVSSREAGIKRKPPVTGGLKSGASSSGETSANPQERAAAALRELRRSGA